MSQKLFIFILELQLNYFLQIIQFFFQILNSCKHFNFKLILLFFCLSNFILIFKNTFYEFYAYLLKIINIIYNFFSKRIKIIHFYYLLLQQLLLIFFLLNLFLSFNFFFLWSFFFYFIYFLLYKVSNIIF